MSTSQKIGKLIISRLTLVGTENNDILNSTSTTSAYNVYGYGGNDILNGNAKDDSIWGGDGSDTLSGGADKDALYGEAGDDVLNGDAGNDSLQGGDGNDTLAGGLDDDMLDGGAGDDTVIYATTLFSDAIIESGTVTTTAQGTDTLLSIENMQFKDRTISVEDYYREQYGEFRVNTTTAGTQNQPSMTALVDGSLMVTWTSDQGGSVDVYGQHLDADGKAIGNEFRVNTFTTVGQSNSKVTALNDGSYIATWDSVGQDKSLSGVYGQRYSIDGSVIGGEFRINTHTADNQFGSSVTNLDLGGFVVTWNAEKQDYNGGYWTSVILGVYGQRYAANGTAVGNEFRVNTTVYDEQSHPSVSYLNGGGFVATWQGNVNGANTYDVFGQSYNINGAKVGTEFTLNTYKSNNQSSPSVTTLLDGSFVVTWASEKQDSSNYGIYGQHFDGNGAKVGKEFLINSYVTGNQSGAAVTALADGGFVVTWQSDGQDGSGWGIYGQRYTANGSVAGGEFRVNAYTVGDQSAPSVIGLNDGGFVVSYQSDGQEGNSGIYVSRFDAEGNRVKLGANALPTGGVSIEGKLTSGQTLTVSNNLADADGLGAITYQWQANNVNIGTGDSYTLTGNEIGKTITVIAKYTDLLGTAESVSSAATSVVTEQINHAPIGAVTITGNTVKGQTLTASNTLTDADGLGVVTYQWQANGVNIGTNNSYTLTGDDIGKSVTVIASYTDGLGKAESMSSASTAAIVDAPVIGPAGVSIIGSDFITSEAGDTAVFSVKLNAAPIRDVTVTFTSSDETEGAISNPSLTFTSVNWATAQTFTVTGQDDVAVDNTIAYQVTGSINTIDVKYSGLTISPITLTNNDNDVTGQTIYGDVGGSLNDIIVGTTGDDKIYGLNLGDDLSGGLGNDLIYGDYGDDLLFGEEGDDKLYGEQDNDRLEGGSGNDLLDGGLGVDNMIGGAGNDTYYLGYDVADVIDDQGLATDVDTVIMPYQLTSYTLPAGIEQGTIVAGTVASNLTGNTGDNALTGNDGKNILSGAVGRDSLFGGAGNDVLLGGTGNDTLSGGSGKDIFKFNVALTDNTDKVTDFVVVDDTIQLENAIFTKLKTTGILNTGMFVKASTAVDSNDYVVYNPATGSLTYDADGAGAGVGVQIALLGVNLALTNVDFVII